MTTPHTWTQADVRTFLRAFGRTPSTIRIERLPSWWRNLILRIDADDERLVLRRYGLTPPDEVRWELAVLAHLAQHGFPTIRPLARAGTEDERVADFDGAPAILYPFIEGVSGREVEWALAVEQTTAAVARLHDLMEGVVVPHARSASGAESRRMISELMRGCSARGVEVAETALLDLLRRAERTVRDFQTKLERRRTGLRRGIVHHDAHARNVLFHHGKLVALIDFDDAHEGYLVSDVAVMVTNWATEQATDEMLNLEQAARVVGAYERHRPLTDTERDLLPDFILLHLLSDSASYVWGRLQQGAPSDDAVTECQQYRRFLHHVDDADFKALMLLALGTVRCEGGWVSRRALRTGAGLSLEGQFFPQGIDQALKRLRDKFRPALGGLADTDFIEASGDGGVRLSLPARLLRWDRSTLQSHRVEEVRAIGAVLPEWVAPNDC